MRSYFYPNFKKNEDQLFGGYPVGVGYNVVLDSMIVLGSGEEITYPISLEEAKDFCDISREVSTDDALIEAFIIAAFEMCENHTAIGFTQQTRTAVLSNPNGNGFIPYGPIGEVESLSYQDEVQDSDSYEVVGVKWKQLKTPYDRVNITYVGGYEALPALLKTAVLNTILYLYDNRATGVDNIGPIAQMILNPISRKG